MIPNKNDIDFIALSESNLHWFPPLFKAVFGKHISVNWVKKKYDFSAWGKPYLGIYAVLKNQVIGFTGGCYVQFQYHSQQEWACIFTDSMIHPSYQGKNIYVDILHALKELAKEEGNSFCIGFTNVRSFHPGVKKGKWLIANMMIGFDIKTYYSYLFKYCRVIRNMKWYRTWSQAYLKKWIVPFNSIAFQQNDDFMHVIHDEAFFDQKIGSHRFLLTIDGVLTWIKLGNKFLEVGYIEEINENKLFQTIESLKNIASCLLYSSILCQFSNGMESINLLQKKYKSFESWPILYSNLSSTFPYEKIAIHYCDTDSF